MARFFGAIGYGASVEQPEGSGKWVNEITERNYRGDVIRESRQLEADDKVNRDISVSNSISVVADGYAKEHFMEIKYVRLMGKPWVVTSVELKVPRLILNLGSVYNGPTP